MPVINIVFKAPAAAPEVAEIKDKVRSVCIALSGNETAVE